MSDLSSRHLALHVARLAADKGGQELQVLALPDSHPLFDFAVIVTGRSDRQVHAIADEAFHFCKRHVVAHFPVEGESGWYLLDCGSVVLHAMSEEMRQFYRLESLWHGAKPVDHERELAALPDLDAAPAARTRH